MNIEIIKTVIVSGKTPKGLDIKVSGGRGMFNLEIGKRKVDETGGNLYYVDEIDSIIESLTKFKEAINNKQEI